MYGSETWRVTKTNTNKLQIFINKCVKNVLQLRWQEMIPNEELLERTGQEQIITEKKEKRLGMDWPYSSEACNKYNETGT